MRYLFTFIFILVLASPVGSCLSQVLDTLTLDLDSVITADVTYLYSGGVIQERIYYKGVVVDIRVVYIWRGGLLLRREWWRGVMVKLSPQGPVFVSSISIPFSVEQHNTNIVFIFHINNFSSHFI